MDSVIPFKALCLILRLGNDVLIDLIGSSLTLI